MYSSLSNGCGVISYCGTFLIINDIEQLLICFLAISIIFDNRGPSSQGYGVSSGHVWM